MFYIFGGKEELHIQGLLIGKLLGLEPFITFLPVLFPVQSDALAADTRKPPPWNCAAIASQRSMQVN